MLCRTIAVLPSAISLDVGNATLREGFGTIVLKPGDAQ